MPKIHVQECYQIDAIGLYITSNGLGTCDEFRLMSIDRWKQDEVTHNLVPAYGDYAFEYKSEKFTFTRKRIAPPVQSRSHLFNTYIHEDVVVSGPTIELINSFCKEAICAMDFQVDNKLTTYSWDATTELWKRDSFTPIRSFDSVIIDKKHKSKLIADIDDFTSDETREWYTFHSIPFRRGYMLHGPPGTGKTSTILAVASKTRRKIYRVNLVAPKLCDNSLLIAMNNVEKESIIVMEDVDALFGKFRDKQEEFSVTFSGLLKAIDGIGDNTRGIIFIFTSNHPERLDPALRRKGRIDMNIPLSYCTTEQCIDMFLRFYPNENKNAILFAKAIGNITSKSTPAQLQHHFISMRKCTATEATVVDASIFEEDDDFFSNNMVM